MITAVIVSGFNAVTGANMRSASVELTGVMKSSYDRAVMLKRTQRLAMNLDSGVWWVDFTDDPFALAKDRIEGERGETEGEADEDEDDSPFDDDVDETVKNAMRGGAATRFGKDDAFGGAPVRLPTGVCFSRVWSEHQEEPFTKGIAYLHFFPGGWSEAARIELVDTACDDKAKPENDNDNEYVTLRVLPLTGRVRMYERKMKTPQLSERGRDDDD